MKKKILLVSHSMSRTGAPRVLLNIANSLDKNDYDVSIYNVNSALNDIVNEINSDVKYFKYNSIISKYKSNKYFPINYLFKVLGKLFSIRSNFEILLKKVKPDLVIINTLFHMELSTVTKRKGIRTIRYFHELDSYLFSLSEQDQLNFLFNSDILWACSKKVKESIQNYYNKDNIEIVYPLVFNDIIKTKYIKENNNFTVISGGSICFRKGFDLWIEVAIQTVSENKNIVFKWFGNSNPSDSYFKYYLNQIPKSLKNNILYCGETNMFQLELSKADLFFLPSREDPFPIVTIEALNMGLPCVGYKSGGIEELEDLGVAKTFNFNDMKKVSNAILDFSKNPSSIDEKKCLEIALLFESKKVLEKINHLIKLSI